MKIRAMDLGTTAAVLYQAFGPERNWRDFLTDCNRSRTDFQGFQLLPIARVRPDKGRCRRPVYALDDIVEFIRNVRDVWTKPAAADKLRRFTIDVPDILFHLPWQARLGELVP